LFNALTGLRQHTGNWPGKTVLLGLLLLVGLAYYFRQAFASQKNRTRIVDLLVVGIILFMSPKIHVFTEPDPLTIAGLFVFAYAWGILIVEKFWEGYKNN
jgi:hypothetical protein